MRKNALLLLGVLFFLLSACAAEESAAKPVEMYLQAVVDQDADRLATLVCSDWADDAVLELDAFMGVKAELDNVQCSELQVSGDEASVTCTGSIDATYNNEQQQFTLEGREYRVVKEGGEWLMCGYQ